ncbi:hypothetical protein GDO81_017865 [Engystomops pustulosus]|uniref:Reelin domain-containing protein n=1 Tax=Engystomops pustulosus TaxID=76066 RepID=A0AAV7A2Y1_ENGPU|nr:hypothetical protein GDO81_017865 [Engystomops pustulosus]KAG8555932.1 hypothetical protein GDO81_017865 [Engystomops pustulosus]
MALFLQNIAVFFLASFPMYLYAYPNGQVTDSCVTMTPSHGVPAQTSSPPYILSLDKNTYSAGDKIKVTLGSSSGVTQFKGFLIQARSGSATVPVGSFVTSNSNSQTLTCTSAASSVSHTSSTGKTSIDVTWVAPMTNVTDIQIRATVVQTGSVFWTNVASAKIAYVPISTPSTTVGNTSTTSTTVGNTSTTSTTVKNDISTSTLRIATTSGVQRTWALGGLLLSCGIMIASFLAF